MIISYLCICYLLGVLRKLQCIDKFLDVPVQYIIQVVDRQVDPVVGYPALGEIIGADLGAPVPGAYQTFAVAGDFLLLFADLLLVELRAHHIHGLLPVTQLGAFRLAHHHCSGGDVGKDDLGFHLIDVLPAFTSAACCAETDFPGNIYLHFVKVI